jgi:hypothetical protein
MPHKFNADRRAKIPKQKHRVTNWSEYNEGLRRRGDLTVWISEDALAVWSAPPRTTAGGQPVYSDLAIEMCLRAQLIKLIILASCADNRPVTLFKSRTSSEHKGPAWAGRNRMRALGRVDKAHPAMDCGDLEEAEEAFGGLVVARRDAAKLLQQTHHALDAVAPCKAAAVQRARRFAVRLPRNNGARAAQIQLHAQAVGARILCRREARAGGSGQARSGPGRPRCRPPVRASDRWREAGRSPRSRRGSWLRTRHGTGPRHSNESPFLGPGAHAGAPPLAHANMRCWATELRCCRSFGS